MLLVGMPALEQGELAGDVLGGHAAPMYAFITDVGPALPDWRESRDLERNPFAAFRASGHLEKITPEPVGGQQMGWGA